MNKLILNVLKILSFVNKVSLWSDVQDIYQFIPLKTISTDDVAILESARCMYKSSFNQDGSYKRIQSYIAQVIVSDIMDIDNVVEKEIAEKLYREYLIIIIKGFYRSTIDINGNTILNFSSSNTLLSQKSFSMVYAEVVEYMFALNSDIESGVKVWDLYNERVDLRLRSSSNE